MKLLTASQMREVDRRTMTEIGIPGTTLMENAGIAVVQVLEEEFEKLDSFHIGVICGRGNNGGDGFVIARHLFLRGITPHVYVIGGADGITGDARVNLEIIRNYRDIPIADVTAADGLESLRQDLQSFHLVVDALLGTGLSQPADGLQADVIRAVNDSPATVVSVDLPSGLFADEYRPVETAVFADLTVTFTAPKPGLILGDAGVYTGDLYTVSIGTPDFLLDVPKHALNLLSADDVRGFFLPRKKDTHKGNFGHILVVGGGRGKTGAVKLAGLAALRSGAGLVTIAVPAPLAAVAAGDVPELMVEALPGGDDGCFSPAAAGCILELLKTRDVLVLGPGLGCQPESVALIRELLPQLEVPVILDADALNCLAEDPELLKRIQVSAVLTPHPGEMARLVARRTGEVQENREMIAQDFARKYGHYLILKGHRTVAADPDGQVWINPTGNPGMATAGSGDVLSGILGAFCARINHQNPEAWALACNAAVYVHGLAGDLATEKLSEESVIARDIVRFICPAIRRIRES